MQVTLVIQSSPIPRRLMSWTTEDVVDWLDHNNFPEIKKYASKTRLDGPGLLRLKQSDLAVDVDVCSGSRITELCVIQTQGEVLQRLMACLLNQRQIVGFHVIEIIPYAKYLDQHGK